MLHLMELLCLLVSSALTGVFAAELSVKPFGDSHTKPLTSSIVFTCEVTEAKDGDGSYSVKWFDNNQQEIKDKSGKMYIEEESGSSKKLYITGIETKDEGSYKCTAVVDGTLRTRTVRLVLYQDISFDHAPSMQNPEINKDALIECRVSGSPTISWRYNGARITTGKGSRFEVETAKGLHIKNITKADDGEYTCRAEVESEGRYDERKITVVVHIRPSFTKRPNALMEGIEGESVSVECRATGLPLPKFEFFKDNMLNPISSTDRITVDTDRGDLHFKPVKHEDAGNYTCKANNDVAKESAYTSLRVNVKPYISDFKDAVETEGQTVTLVCISRGAPAPNMTFQKTGQPAIYKLGENEAGRFTVRSTGAGRLELSILSLVPEDAGQYTCKSVIDNVGHNESTATLTVNFQPRFAPKAINHVYIWAGKSRNISCSALAEPAPSIEWLKHGIPLSNNDTYHVYTSGRNSSLLVRMKDTTQTWIYNEYTCQATNSYGTGQTVIELREAKAPTSVLTVNVTDVRPDRVALNVTESEKKDDLEITGYRVVINGIAHEFVTGTAIVLENLTPSTTYDLKVMAKNEVGVGSATPKTFKTAPIRVPYPINISSNARADTGHEFTLTWDKPSTGGRPIEQYEFKYKKTKGSSETNDKPTSPADEWTTLKHDEDHNSPIWTYIIKPLEPESAYELYVKVKNDQGWSEQSPIFSFQTVKATDVEMQRMRSSAGVGAVIAIFFILLILVIVVDVSCFFFKRVGVTAYLYQRFAGASETCSKEKAMEQGDGSGSKELLKEPILESMPSDEAVSPPELAVAAAELLVLSIGGKKEEGKSLLENEIIDDISKNELKKEIQNEEDNKIDDPKANSIADDKKVTDDVPDVTVTVTDNDTRDQT